MQVRSLIASNGKNVQEAGPSVAVQMLGLSSVPSAGDEFGVVDSEQSVSPSSQLLHAVDLSAQAQSSMHLADP